MKTRNVVLSISIVMLAIACEKQLVKNSDQVKSDTRELSSGSLDYLGEDHNGALDTIANDTSFGNQTDQDVLDIITEYLENNGQYDYSNDPAPSLSDWATDAEVSISDVAQDKYDLGEISSDEKDYYDDLEDILETSTESNIVQELEDFESDVENDQGLTTDAQEALIGASVIARYSFEYWQDAYYDQNNPHHTLANQNVNPNDDIPFLPDLKADAQGFVGGMLNGGGLTYSTRKASWCSAAGPRKF